MTIKRMTKNRKTILKLLGELDFEGKIPPFAAENILYVLGCEYGIEMTISQLNRTLRDLVAEGLITYEERVEKTYHPLPQRIRYYYLPETIETFIIKQEIRDTLSKAKYLGGNPLTGYRTPTTEEKDSIIKKIRSLIQKTHTDKVSGFEYENVELIKAMKNVREM